MHCPPVGNSRAVTKPGVNPSNRSSDDNGSNAKSNAVDTSSLSGIEAASRQPSTADKLSNPISQGNILGEGGDGCSELPHQPAGAIAAASAQGSASRLPIKDAPELHNPGAIEAQGFKTMDAAAFNAVEKSNPYSIKHDVEVGGAIVQDPDTNLFHATEPVKGNRNSVNMHSAEPREGFKTVGDYHTHGDYVAQDNPNTRATRIADTKDASVDRYSDTDVYHTKFRGQNVPGGHTGYLGTPSGDFRVLNSSDIDRTLADLPRGMSADRFVQDSRLSIPVETVKTNGRNGAAIGGAVEAGVATYSALQDGYQHSDLGTIATETTKGAAVGGITAAGEHYVERGIERTLGSTVQRMGMAAARNGLDDVALGTAARTVVSRAGGAGVVGAAVGAVVSIHENREGLANFESEAIGDVVADTAVATGAALAGAAMGAAIGTAVPIPVIGTVVGAVVGLAVGFGVDYIARKGGVDEVISNVVSGGVDLAKSAGKKVADFFGW